MSTHSWIGGFALVLMVGGSAQAAPILLDFEGLDDLEAITNFYNGGTSANGHSGVDYGVSFNADALSIVDWEAGGTGNFANEPSASTVLFFKKDGGAATMSVETGFLSGLSFYYAAENVPGEVRVYDAVGGMGNLLASLSLPVTGSACGGDSTGAYNCWSQVTTTFSGVGRSIAFGGTRDRIVFDDIAFEKAPPPPVPEPALMLLVGVGLGAGLLRRWRS